MDVSVKENWKPMVDDLVQAGRYGSADEIVDEGLRLVQEQESKLAALRAHIEAAIAGGGSYTSEEVLAAVRDRLSKRQRKPAAV